MKSRPIFSRRLSGFMALVVGSGVLFVTLQPSSVEAVDLIGLHRTTNRLLASASTPSNSVQLGSCATSKTDPTLIELREYSVGGWFYTTHPWEPWPNNPLDPNGSTVCYVYANPAPGRVPLQRLAGSGFFYTTCDSEVAEKVEDGWLYQGVEGFLEDEGRGWCDALDPPLPDPPIPPSLTGLHRSGDRLVDAVIPPSGSTQLGDCANSKTDPTLIELREYSVGGWFYTTHPWEPWPNNPLDPNGSTVCYVYANPAPGRVPLQRLAGSGFFYTTCDSEVAEKVEDGWLYQGVEGFLLDEGRDWCAPIEPPQTEIGAFPEVSSVSGALDEGGCSSAGTIRTCPYTVTMTVSGVTTTADGWLAYPTNTSISSLLVYGHGCCRSPSGTNEGLDVVNAYATSSVAAVSMHYRGDGWWNVMAGAQDLIAATLDLQDNLDTYSGMTSDITQTVLWGVSMGGETTGLALAARPDLYDYWVDTFGVTNLFEEWGVLRASPHPSIDLPARIENEAGGKPYEAFSTYMELSPVFRAAEMARATVTTSDGVKPSRLKRAYFSHGVGDFVVPYSQSRQMASALVAHGVPVSFHTVISGPCDTGCLHVWGQNPTQGPTGPGGHDPSCKRSMYPSCWGVVRPILSGSIPDDGCVLGEWFWNFMPSDDYQQQGSGLKNGGCIPHL